MNFQIDRKARQLLYDMAEAAFVAEEITTLTAADPFGIDDPCPQNPEGHFQIWGDRRTLVCAHCSKVIWS